MLSRSMMAKQSIGSSNPDLVSFGLSAGGTTAQLIDITWDNGGTIYFWIEGTDAPYGDHLNNTGGAPSPLSAIQFAGLTAGKTYKLWWYFSDLSVDDANWIDTGIAWTQPGKFDDPYITSYP